MGLKNAVKEFRKHLSTQPVFITQKQITDEHPALKDKKKLFQPSWFRNKSEDQDKGQNKRK